MSAMDEPETKHRRLSNTTTGLQFTPITIGITHKILSLPECSPEQATVLLKKISATDPCFLNDKQRCDLIEKCLNRHAIPCLDIYGKELGKNSTLRRVIDAYHLPLCSRILQFTNRAEVAREYARKSSTNQPFIKRNEGIDALLKHKS